MRVMFVAACALALTAAGCTKPKPAETAKAAPPSPYNTSIPIGEVMDHVLNPAGHLFWDSWGTVVDEHGTHDLSPKNDAEWEKVEDGATTIVIGLNAIMVPGYWRAPQDEWNKLAKEVQDIAIRGREAAERKDIDAVGEIGQELDKACDDCHVKFVISTSKPPPSKPLPPWPKDLPQPKTKS